MSSPRISLVVVSWNSADVLVDLLDALVAHPPVTPWEVIVVDNASADHTCELVRAHPAGARLIANADNLGLASANNIGMAAARGGFFVICNPDIVPLPGALVALVAVSDRRPRAGFVIGRLQHPDGTLLTGVGDLPTLREAFAGRRAARVRAADAGFWWDGWTHDQERQIGHGQEACYLVRRAAVDAVGPQDVLYWLDWEGVDWADRMHQAGWDVWFTPASQVVHVGGTSLSKARVRWVVWSHRGMYRYFSMRGPRWHRPFLAMAIGARGGLKLALLVRPDLYQRGLRVDK
ncbi:MAG: glycosyltransferase family 2 protein [Pseudorhodobacter sp.]|nr:glycosyltransferase family 2 protein [Frankiaceae bacterium]